MVGDYKRVTDVELSGLDGFSKDYLVEIMERYVDKFFSLDLDPSQDSDFIFEKVFPDIAEKM